jgi:poly(3-hydroxybutyrate) depolymerase
MDGLPLYQWYEMQHAAMSPVRAAADATRLLFQNPINPWTHTLLGKSVAAGCELFERATRRYVKPDWGISSTVIGGRTVAVRPEVAWQRPFCQLVHFARAGAQTRNDPRMLIVAPMSGHYATLLRGTVEAFLPDHDVYVTDWSDARVVPLAAGSFDLDDYIEYVIDILHHLGTGTHVIAVCQPSVPVLAAVSVMAARRDRHAPRSMTLMGGPIDTRRSPTAVNNLAEEKGLAWFEHNVITRVPFPNPGAGRLVYPGFLQISGFMGMNLSRHIAAHRDMYMHLVRGDGDSAQKHREFYDEYLAVMDLTAEFYLQTVETVFIRHDLPKGQMVHRGELVEPGKIRNTALLTVEGEHDDISGVGQTEAAQRLCTGIPAGDKQHHLQRHVGHYGVFNGSRFRGEIAPRIAAFIREHNGARVTAFPSARAQRRRAHASGVGHGKAS